MAQPAKRSVAYLAVSQAFGQIMTAMILSTTARVGNMLATDKALATLPHALGWVALALVAIPVSQMMRRIGRRTGFMAGAVIGIAGALIARYGGARIMLIGAVLMIGCVMAALAGLEVWNFWLANVLVGVGWNFLLVSATAMLTETYASDERAKVQGFNDFCVFGTVAFTTFTSGWLQNVYGWATVNYSVAPFLALVIVAILWLFARTRTAPAATE